MNKPADDDDMGAMWRDVKAARQAKRAENRASSPKLLRDAGIAFVEKNEGAHLIVTAGGLTIDFWPGTGLWVVRSVGRQRRGAHQLVMYCQALKGDAA